MNEIYSTSYFDRFRETSRTSAQCIVPLILEWIAPASVIDLGCGVGEWLAAFREAGVQDVQGVDGEYVLRDELAIPQELFIAADLTVPYRADRSYELAMSVEVGEHLPPASAESLVQSLTELAPVVLFSAAIPNQPGTHHVNGEWPIYWANMFAQRGFVVVDAIRFRLWDDPRVDWWYRQNLMIYVREEQLKRWPALEAAQRAAPAGPLSLVHPDMFMQTYRDLMDWGVNWEQKYWKLWEETRADSPARPGPPEEG